MGNLVYEDDPWALRLPYWTNLRAYWSRGPAVGIHILPVTFTILIVGVLLALYQEAVFLGILGLTCILTAAVGLALCPTKYQIFNEKIRIVLGYILHFDIPFNNIENATAATFGNLWGLNLNFINSYSGDDILQIIRKCGAKIHITPWDRKLFLEHLNKALADWRRSNPS